MKPLFNKIKQFDQILIDFKGLELDEELLVSCGNRKYIVRVATERDIQNHEQEQRRNKP